MNVSHFFFYRRCGRHSVNPFKRRDIRNDLAVKLDQALLPMMIDGLLRLQENLRRSPLMAAWISIFPEHIFNWHPSRPTAAWGGGLIDEVHIELPILFKAEITLFEESFFFSANETRQIVNVRRQPRDTG